MSPLVRRSFKSECPATEQVNGCDCKPHAQGALPWPDSNLFSYCGIGVDRYMSVFQTEVERALLSCRTILIFDGS